MRHLSSATRLLLLTAAAIGCGGGGGGGGNGPDEPVLTSVDVTPPDVTVFTLAPANRVRLRATPRDQDGGVMDGVSVATFTSANEAIATVDAEGVVTAVAAGTVRIIASMTADGSPVTGGSDVVVAVAQSTASVSAPEFTFTPQVVDVAAGGEVTWVVASIHHTVDFTTSGAPTDIPEMLNQSVSRSFPTPGSFEYHCNIHNAMHGTVRVH